MLDYGGKMPAVSFFKFSVIFTWPITAHHNCLSVSYSEVLFSMGFLLYNVAIPICAFAPIGVRLDVWRSNNGRHVLLVLFSSCIPSVVVVKCSKQRHLNTDTYNQFLSLTIYNYGSDSRGQLTYISFFFFHQGFKTVVRVRMWHWICKRYK